MMKRGCYEGEAERRGKGAKTSQHIVETVKESHHFKIEGFSLAKGIGPGKYLASKRFAVGGHEWCIYFYPDGKNPDDNGVYVSVFVALVSDAKDVRAKFELRLLDQSGKGRHKVHTHFHRSENRGPYTLKYCGSMWGYKRFYKRSILETSDFIKDDALQIDCTVGVVVSETRSPKSPSIALPESNLAGQFGELFETMENTDVTFVVSGKRFQVHKLFLAARSCVFKEMLYDPSKDSCEEFYIDNMHPDIFNAMLRYIYTDTLPDLDDHITDMDSDDSMNSRFGLPIMLEQLFDAANRYGLCRLQGLCESKLSEQITLDTVANIFALAHCHQAKQLKMACLQFMASNLDVFMVSEGYEYLKQNHPSLQLELLQTIADVDNCETSMQDS